VSQDACENNDVAALGKIEVLENNVDSLCREFTENHIERIKSEGVDPRCAVIFTDIIVDLERSADHAEDIAASMLARSKRGAKKTRKGKVNG
jgi:phosphate:Na+ symporter